MPFACDKCDRSFAMSYELKIHKKRNHVYTRPHRCNQCGMYLTTKSSLPAHLKSHADKGSLFCNLCNKDFSNKDALTSHTCSHPFACSVCGRGFSSKASLLAHREVHTGERPFLCQVCGKRFSESYSLTLHKGVHARGGRKLHTCKECGSCFSTEVSLWRHMKLHADQQLLACDECDEQFTCISDLSVHKRIHTSEKPCGCSVCLKSFHANPSTLRHHGGNVHKLHNLPHNGVLECSNQGGNVSQHQSRLKSGEVVSGANGLSSGAPECQADPLEGQLADPVQGQLVVKEEPNTSGGLLPVKEEICTFEEMSVKQEIDP